MRITQGTFSFLPDLTDEQIAAQVRYALKQGWSVGVEHTDDPHPRNPYWSMWGTPMFDLQEGEEEALLREVNLCRDAHPREYIKVIAYDSNRGKQTTRLSFIVHRPPFEPGFRMERTDQTDRVMRYKLHPYATDDWPGRRYGEHRDGNRTLGTDVEALPGAAGLEGGPLPAGDGKANEEA